MALNVVEHNSLLTLYIYKQIYWSRAKAIKHVLNSQWSGPGRAWFADNRINRRQALTMIPCQVVPELHKLYSRERRYRTT